MGFDFFLGFDELTSVFYESLEVSVVLNGKGYEIPDSSCFFSSEQASIIDRICRFMRFCWGLKKVKEGCDNESAPFCIEVWGRFSRNVFILVEFV